MKFKLVLFFVLILLICIPLFGDEEEDIAVLSVDGAIHTSIPLGKTVILPVTGSASGEFFIENLSPDMIEVKGDQIANHLNLRGLKPGQASFVIVRANIRRVIYLAVKEPAGILPQKVTITVTGNPASRNFLRDAALRAVFAKTSLKPRSYLLFDEYVPFECPAYLARGEKKSFELPVKIESVSYFPVRDSVDVEVTNQIVNTSEAAFLMISNRPEKIEEDGILFNEEIKPGEPVRLLVYHQNSPNSMAREFLLKLTNPTTAQAEVKIISGLSGPSWDVFFTGHKATERFLEDYATDCGQVILIPPKGEYTLFKTFMKPGEVIAGLLEMHILNDSPLVVTTQAGQPDIEQKEVLSDEFNLFSIHPKGVFAKPDVFSEFFFNVGDADLEIPVGVSPWLLDIETGAPNQGNYGVVYKFNVILSNYEQEERSVKFYFAPVNGVARGVFVINDILYETDLIRPGKLSLIENVVLAPMERRVVKIFTTPQSASYYPVKLLIRSD